MLDMLVHSQSPSSWFSVLLIPEGQTSLKVRVGRVARLS